MLYLRMVFLIGFLGIGLTSCMPFDQPDPDSWYYEASTSNKSYADVLAELELAVTDRNFRITGHNKVGSVIRERGYHDFPDYDALQFCNLSLAREMLLLESAAIRYMPCNATVRSEAGKIFVSVHLLPTDSQNIRLNQFAKGMNVQLKEIVDFAVGR